MRTLIALLLSVSVAAAQFGNDAKSFADVAKVETSISPKQAKPGEIVTVKLTVTPEPGCTTYPTKARAGQTSLNKLGSRIGDLVVVKPAVDPAGLKEKPGVLKGEKEYYYDSAVTFEFQAIVLPLAVPGKKTAKFDGTTLLACANQCFNSSPADIPPLEFEIVPGSVPVSDEHLAIIESIVNPTAKSVKSVEMPEAKGLIRKEAKATAEYVKDMEAITASMVKAEGVSATPVGSGLGGLLAAAVFWGLVSLVTPCVFPMIPITVSLFLKQAHQSTSGAVKYALVYCLTIVVVLGLGAVFLLSVFRELSVSPVMNVLLGLLLFAFALSLFGMFDIQLPGFLLRATEKRRAGGGLIGTVFGALAFSIVSFTCVAPFLGGFAGLAATGNYSQFELLLAGLTFAASFASPFFVLALFPSLLKKMPKSGGWLDTVKAVMGFLELAAAFKFFRTAELRVPPVDYFTFDVVLAAWVVIAITCGLYLLRFFRLPHDDHDDSALGVPRLIFALAFLGLGVYLAPGLVKGPDGKALRSNGVVFAWVESFLLPEPGESLPWSADLKASLEAARKEKKKVFIDFTGVTCTNCRYNEHTVFPGVHDALAKFKLVQLYTDDVPADFYRSAPPLAERSAEGQANLAFQKANFKTEQLPLYVILEPLADGKVLVVGVYAEGKINNPEAFKAFVTR